MRRLLAVVSKNLRMKYRLWMGTLIEICLPAIFLLFLMWLRSDISVYKLRANNYIETPENNPTYIPLRNHSLHQYGTGVREKSFWTSENLDGYMWLHLQWNDQRIAIVNNQSLADFISSIPGYENVTMTFNSSAELEEYVGHKLYGYVKERPQVFAALDVKNASPDRIDVAIRMNTTAFEAVDTHWPTWFSIQTAVNFQLTKIFWNGAPRTWNVTVENKTTEVAFLTGGFIDLQSLVYSWAYREYKVFNIPDPKTLPVCDVSDCKNDIEVLEKVNLPYTGGRVPPGEEGCRGRLDALFPLAWREVPFPTNDTIKDKFASIMRHVFGLFFVLVFLWPLAKMLKSCVEDKENHLFEVMRIMGLPEEQIMAGWYVSGMITWALSTTIIVLVPCSTIFYHSNTLAVWLFFFIFGCTVLSFCAFVSSFFTSTKMAMVMGCVSFLMLYFPYYLFRSSDFGVQILAMLSPPSALAFGTSLMAQLESNGIGLQFENLFVPVNGTYCMADVITMFLVDIVFYALLHWYFDKVVRTEDRLPWHFIFASCRTRVARIADYGPFATLCPGSPTEEPVGEELLAKRSVAIRNLQKTFGTFRAVDGVSYDLFEDHLFVLLGHNGAGKTTTINMLTGMLSPSGGDALVYDSHSLTRDVRAIRSLVGFCPQHNVTWDHLTVYEHLQFFAAVKNVPGETLEEHIYHAMHEVGLEEKANTLAKALSGGQKRRLSLAIAFLGDSKIVFLDEPTSGVDPASRREIWDFLRKAKQGRTILLTTHFMDEAEILGDRIAIMHKGRLACAGNPFFLKSLYGVGYNVTIQHTGPEAEKALVDHLGCLYTRTDNALSARVAFDASSEFPALFTVLEQNGWAYGVSVTTLEEVFLKVGLDDDAKTVSVRDDASIVSEGLRIAGGGSCCGVVADSATISKSATISPADGKTRDLAERSSSAGSRALAVSDIEMQSVHAISAPLLLYRENTLRRQMGAILAKRFHYSKRDVRGWICQIIVPLSFLLVALLSVRYGGYDTFYSSPLTLESIAGVPTEILVAQREGNNTWLPVETTTTTARTDVEFAQNLTDGYYTHGDQRFAAFFVEEQSAVNNTRVTREVLISYNGMSTKSNVTFTIPPLLHPNGTMDSIPGHLHVSCESWNISNDTFIPLGAAWDDTINIPIQHSRLGKMNISVPAMGRLTNRIGVDVFWNSTARDGLPIAFHYLANSVMHSVMKKRKALNHSEREPVDIYIESHPLPYSKNMLELFDSSSAIFLALGFAFIPASYVAFIVKERRCGSKHLQVLAGVHFAQYWAACWVWDLLNFVIPALCAFALIVLFDVSALVDNGNGWYTMSLIMAYGFAICPFTYMLSFLFASHTTALICILVSYFFSGGILAIVAVILAYLPDTKDMFASTLVWYFRLSPNYCLADGLNKLVLVENPFMSMLQVDGDKKVAHPGDLDITGYDIIYLLVGGIVYFIMTLILEYIFQTPYAWQWFAQFFSKFLSCCPRRDPGPAPQRPTDDLVIAERERLVDENRGERVQVLGLTKEYNQRPVVNDIYFGIGAGQCLAYLGVNGAGKTTTMKMLTGDLIPTSGTARLDGHDILTAQDKVRRNLGYCPQFDALLDNLTGREHLVYFGRLRGFEEDELKQYVTELLGMLTLTMYADVCVKHYSGGNKRKLSIGIALIADPPLLFLDEPTTGVDPISRRFIWNVIRETIERTRASVILTTHSMDECEALCHRAAIIHSGTLQCIGTLGEIKARYGFGYQLGVTLPASASLDRVDDVETFITCRFPDATRIERNIRKVQYQLTKRQPLSEVFALMEIHKGALNIQEYAVSDTSIEQIFVRFAKSEEGNETDIPTMQSSMSADRGSVERSSAEILSVERGASRDGH